MQLNFNAATVPPAEPGASIWEGAVLCMIRRTEVVETAAKNGNKFLALHVTALDGQYKGEDNVIRLNLWNSNQTSADVAQRQLSSICHVTGRMQIQDSDHLIGAPFISVWATEERDVQDTNTGAMKKIKSCQAKDFRYQSGQTIREAMSGQPAASPYVAGATQQPMAGPATAPTAPQTFTAPTQGPAPTGPGFAPSAPPAAPPSFMPPVGMPSAGPTGPAAAPPQVGPNGFPVPAAPGAPTPGYQPPFPGAPLAPPAAPPAPPTGYPQPAAAPQQFQPPGGPQPGPGPWNPNGQ